MTERPAHTQEGPSSDAPVRPHEFDGIQEFDNPMPNWWLAILFASVVFAFGYWAALHEYTESQDPGKALVAEMEMSAQEAARKAGVLNNEILWKMSSDASVLRAGKETYLASCAPCHLPDMGGAIGPNLRDEVWIHGGQPMDILNAITEGVAVKGMPTWGPILGRKKISEVAAYILSFQTSAATTAPQP